MGTSQNGGESAQAVNPDFQGKLRDIFLEAVEIEDPATRAGFLEQACGGDHALRRRLGELLLADSGGREAVTPVSEPDAEQAGGRVGSYKLLQQIGEGGCGVVFMAEQERPIRREVALKLIKLGMDTRQVIARFEAERQALAMMDHPNIAKVLDAGATQTGRPYFVMELVRGTKITDYCDQNNLSTRQRLGLFTQVCEAVQHAHRRGIIHRDLKPSNILVAELHGAPVPKVIDFGIAKAIEGRLTDQTLFTAFEQFLGTPAYMSPEQAAMNAADVDTRTDIYSLGVLLYELLTGKTPFDTKALLASGLDEMRRTIREREPVRPSTRLNQDLSANSASPKLKSEGHKPCSRRLLQEIREDLDWVVMKCLEKDRRRRYETANALAMDLKRHLGNQPVLARPPSPLYEFQKSVRRHKFSFSAAAIVVVTLTAGIIASTWEAARARRAEERERHQAYISDMRTAQQYLNEGRLGPARDLLRRYVSKPGGAADLRNWEWRYLANECQGDPHFALTAHSSHISNVRFLNDNTLLTTGMADWRTILWNVPERRPQTILTNQAFGGAVSPIMALAPKRHALYYCVPWPTRIVRLLALDSGMEGDCLTNMAEVVSLDISPDQNLLAIAAGARVDLWNLQQHTVQHSFPVQSYAVSRTAFSPDDRLLAIGDMSGHLDFWDLSKHTHIGTLTNDVGGFGALRFSRDGRWLVNPGGERQTRVCRVEDRSWIADLEVASCQNAAFSADCRTLAVVGGDSVVRLWDTATWRKRASLRGHTDKVWSVDFSPDGRLLATGSRNGEVMVWPLEQTPNAADSASFTNKSAYVAPAADGSCFARIPRWTNVGGAYRFPEVELWASTPLGPLGTIPTAGLPVNQIALLPQSRGLVLACSDGTVHLRRLGVEKETFVSYTYGGYVEALDVSLDGSTLVTLRVDPSPLGPWKVNFWRLPQLTPMGEALPSTTVLNLRLSEEGGLVAGFTGPGDMGVWRVPPSNVAPLWHAFGALENVPAAAFSPDNRCLAAAVGSGGLFIWDLAARRRSVLAGAPAYYSSLSYSRDGTRLVAGSVDEAKLFEAATGEQILSLEPRGLQLAFLEDGERLLAVNAEGAFVLRAPPLKAFRDCAWLKEGPYQEPPDYTGPRPPGVRFAPARRRISR